MHRSKPARRDRLRTHVWLAASAVLFLGASSIAPGSARGDATDLATGLGFACALDEAGGARCWGGNASGQLGDGTTTQRSSPGPVSGLASGVLEIETGISHACALNASGGVVCWGNNAYGQLGDGSTTNSSLPVAVSGLASGVAAIEGGNSHTCALTTGGAVLCWGRNNFGQLGNGTTTDSSVPVASTGTLASNVAELASFQHHSCARTTGGAVHCWGYNLYGQLGDGSTTNRTSAVPVTGLGSGIGAIATGYWFSCARSTGGAVSCWGRNDRGQLGDGSTTNSSTPVAVSGLASGVGAIAAGGEHACARTTAGALSCWGRNNYGQLGDGTLVDRWTPTAVSNLSSGVASISAGGDHGCARAPIGDNVLCWGRNNTGQLGDGTLISRSAPVGLSGWPGRLVEVASGGSHTCGLSDLGGVVCWGANASGQLGDATTSDRLEPHAVTGLTSGVAALASGLAHSCALGTSGAVSCWGDNAYGQLGDGTTTQHMTPTAISALASGVAAIALGDQHGCALSTSGAVSCWGRNNAGQLGDGTTTDSSAPVAVSGLASGVLAIAAGSAHSCALSTSGALSCWGRNANGQLGDGTTTQRTTPTPVSGLASGVAAIAAGGAHSCALLQLGAIRCWGANASGALGDGTTTQRTTPVAVTGLSSGAVKIAAGGSHSCALQSSGALRC